MNLTIVTAASAEYKPLMDLTLPNKIEYASRWNCTVKAVTHAPGVNLPLDRAQIWLDTLENLPDGDMMWFMGADTLIMNQTLDWQDQIGWKQRTLFNAFITIDLLGINVDSFFMLSNITTKRFLKRLLSLLLIERDEQSAFCRLLASDSLMTCAKLPQRQFNSYLYRNYDEYKHMRDAWSFQPSFDGEYQPSDFVLHLPALPNSQRVKIIKEYLPKVIK